MKCLGVDRAFARRGWGDRGPVLRGYRGIDFRMGVCRFGDGERVPVLRGWRAVLAPLRGALGSGIRPGGPAETQRPCCDST